MIVEGQGMGFWTRVRLPPNPLDREVTNPHPNKFYEGLELAITFADIRACVKQRFDVDVSNSSISQIKKKCCIESFDEQYEFELLSVDEIKSDKEKMILEAFKDLGIVVWQEQQLLLFYLMLSILDMIYAKMQEQKFCQDSLHEEKR